MRELIAPRGSGRSEGAARWRGGLKSARRHLCAVVASLWVIAAGACGAELSQADGDAQARAMIADLISAKPSEGFLRTGLLKQRSRAGQRTNQPVRCEVDVFPDRWETRYEATNAGGAFERLVVTRRGSAPPELRWSENASASATNPPPAPLSPGEAMRPFAGTDFWIADLGLVFLHWPNPRLLKKEMRSSQFCLVVEMGNPAPAPGAYARVVCWFDHDSGGIVRAEAYDAAGKLLKEFTPRDFKKVDGRWEVKEMRIRNPQTGSQTTIEFEFGR